MGETLRAAEFARADHVAEGGGRYESGRRPGGKPGDRRVGVVWHTQGSGKSLTMVVKRILRKHGYPPDKQERATQTVLEQAALHFSEWARA
ncbi:hypothetical protein Pla86_01710 [Planctomycetes bacterium Pla86]|uniref:Type I restriction enzyme HindI endonuclease subunit-like C-terminal domain-containing protein n=1 Tax=Engelhardtia mirabilis TaxID=2528011 RepID=A0A518BDP1_9BACT|nr:hypothetical protein Pla133_01710 [Planctomycetes bacterium Pla133]QDU99433.1 hypothetical protein Pla86_01710 [Planctomycetes bacterium Pla86]